LTSLHLDSSRKVFVLKKKKQAKQGKRVNKEKVCAKAKGVK